MTIIERSIRRPVTVTVIVALIVMFGIIGLTRVPVQLTPNVDQPVVSVRTHWFGASPQEMVRDIVEKQEKVLKSVSGLREMTSESTEGEAVIRLEFSVDVDKDAALNEVRDKLRQVPDLPADADQPIVEAVDRFQRDFIAWVIVREIPGYEPQGPPAPGYDGDVTALGTFMEDFVRPVLERAEGVSEVMIFGGREQELQVRVDLDKLAARGITITQFINAIRDENMDVTAGTVAEGKRDTSVRVVGQYNDIDQVTNTVVARTAAGAPVYVRDVAEVVSSFKKEISFVRSLGQPVLAINAQRETGSNVLVVMDNFKRAVREVNEQVLGPTNWGLELLQVYDQTIYINDSVANATRNLFIGAILAGLVLFITLRSVGATTVVLLAIPISIIGTFLGMSIAGRSLNVISIAGLTFAVGMGIDNAIVVLENIFRHREMGKDRIKAAIEGTLEVAGAIVASTLTNVAVFLPIIFIQEEAGQLFRDMSIALSISFFLYLFVAPTVIPMMTSLFLRRMPAGLRDTGVPQTRLGRLTAPIGRMQRHVNQTFHDIVFWLTGGLARRVTLVVVLITVAVFAAYRLAPPSDYLPTGNQNLIFGILAPPPGYNVDEFRRMANVVEGRLSPWWEVSQGSPEHRALQEEWLATNQQFVVPMMQEQLQGQVEAMKVQGLSQQDIDNAVRMQREILEALRTSPAPAAIDNFFFVKYGAIGFMGASSADSRQVRPLSYLMNGSLQGVPGTFGFFRQAPIFQIAGLGGGIELALYGNDDATVRQAASAVQFGLMQAFNTWPQSNPQSYNLGQSEIQIVPDRVRAAEANVGGAPAIRAMGQVAVDGVIIGDYRDAGRSIDLTVISHVPRDARNAEDLRNTPMATMNEGQVVPLGAVADLVQTSAPQQINRVEEQPAVSFTVDLPPGMPVQTAVAIVNEQVLAPLRESGALPPTVNAKLQGSASKLREFQLAFIPGLLLAILVTYLLLSSLFESFLHPLVIIMSVPFAMAGGFAGLALLDLFVPDTKLDVLTMLGFVILVGTIVNNPILLVYQALNNIRAGMPRRNAIAFSARTRVRPIFMSVTTTVAGLSPLVIFGGAGSELYRGLGAVILGGLIVSTFITLFLTPTLMSLMLDAQEALKRLYMRLTKATPHPVPAEVEGDGHQQPQPRPEPVREGDVVTVRSVSTGKA